MQMSTMGFPPAIQIVKNHDCIYFRLFHNLQDASLPCTDGVKIRTASQDDLPKIVSIINESYDDIAVTLNQMQNFQQSLVYAPEFWLLAVDSLTEETIGCGIADFDSEVGELILEWIQVLPKHRRKGVGSSLVNALLSRKPKGAVFATVSGKADSPSNPEALYRSCGFTGQDYWHILTRKNK